MMTRILGIESSCDETGVALYCSEGGLLAHVVHSQVALHQPFGGVVPELASRDHIVRLIPLIDEVLDRANLNKTDIDAIAYTAGPGLIGALLVGASFAKTLAYALNIPAIGVHHLEGHVLAAQLTDPTLQFPFLSLLVSGGHTQLIEVRGLGSYQILGDTLDDAVGEAFDKTAKCMGLPYPGGPILAALAKEAVDNPHQAIAPFPRPMLHHPELNFSFSGLKTHALTAWKNSAQDEAAKRSIAKAFQDAVVETLTVKCLRALKKTGYKTLVVAGGVGANQALRSSLKEAVQSIDAQVFFPKPEFCTDNGAMIAYAGYLHFLHQHMDQNMEIEVKPRWPLASMGSNTL